MKTRFNLATISFLLAILSAIFPFAIYSQEKAQEDKDAMWIGGRIIWPGHDLSSATVEVFRDPKFTDLYTSGLLLNKEGGFSLTINAPGIYYIVAFVDSDGNGQFDSGDGMGIYGVTEWTDTTQDPSPILLKKGTKTPGIDIQITATADSQGRMIPLKVSGSGVVTGISGKLVWPDHKFPNAILLVYSDPSWNSKIAQVDVKETGEYEISLSAGRYYLLAVIDENSTNLLDVGDKFGVWGMTKFGMFPKAVEVSDGHVSSNRNILIIGQMGTAGKPLPLQETEKEKTDRAVALADKILLSGNVIWPDHDLRLGMVQAYSDPSMTVAAAQAKTDDKGKFRLLVPAGDYYIMAGVDADGDGKYTSGDGIGAYGVANAAEEMPKKLTVIKDPQQDEINMLITAEFDSSGQLRYISEQVQKPSAKPSAATPSTGISGKFTWEGVKLSRAMLIFSDEPRFEGGTKISLELGDDGSYSCSAPPGDYYLMAIADRNESDLIDSGDGRGFYGAGYRGAPQKVTVLDEWITPLINISVGELFVDDGKLSPIKTSESIRFWYGEPGKVYTDKYADPPTQEWWYWDRGFTYTFEETDAGLNLVDTSEFTPVDPDRPPERITERSGSTENDSGGTLYYTFDRIIWAADANGANQRWVVTGTQPTATLDGSKLLFLDTNGSIYLIEPEGDAPAQSILGRRKAGLQPAISHNGKAAAFTQSIGGLRGIVLRNLETDEENPIPVGAMDLYHPAWSSGDESVAYSASSPSADQREPDRDIYHYNLTTGRTQRVSTSPLDEFEPAWSPVDSRTLVYCRAEDGHSQLWIVKFDDDGKPVEHQITKHGGRSPAWSPEGDKIVYENNAQLWIISPDGSGEAPLTVEDEPIFGLDPFWVR
ncbi:TolB family protein [Candidatus Poribacteria bacterium]